MTFRPSPPSRLLLEIQGLGGKTIHLMHEKLGVRNPGDLKRVIKDGSPAALYGMGEKKVENIRTGIEARERVARRPVQMGEDYETRDQREHGDGDLHPTHNRDPEQEAPARPVCLRDHGSHLVAPLDQD